MGTATETRRQARVCRDRVRQRVVPRDYAADTRLQDQIAYHHKTEGRAESIATALRWIGFGTIVDAPAKDMAVVACSQEHGFVGAEEPIPYGNLPIGSRVRILPNHACITAAAYDRYYVVDSELDGGKSVVDIYDRINGW